MMWNHIILSSCMAYAIQEPFKTDLQRLQEHQILAPLGVGKMARWCQLYWNSMKTKWYGEPVSGPHES